MWPKSKVSDQTMMFHTGSVSFLLQNNFDFNKLFENGINFGRYSEKEYLRSQCLQLATKNFESLRSYSVLSQTHQKKLKELMEDIEHFVYDPESTESKTITVESYSLRKAFNKCVNEKYMNTGVFAEFSKKSPEIILKKSKNFKQVNFLKDIRTSSENFEGKEEKVLTCLGFHSDVGSDIDDESLMLDRCGSKGINSSGSAVALDVDPDLLQ